MANSATLYSTLPINCYGATSVYLYLISIDTINTDLTIRTPAAGKMVAVVGFMQDESNAHTMLFKSADTTIIRMEKAGDHHLPIGGGIVFAGARGEALKIQSTAAIDLITMYVIETDQILMA